MGCSIGASCGTAFPSTRRLGVREVWFGERGALTFHVMRGERYVRAARSGLLPQLDPALLTRFMSGGTQNDAVRGLQRAMRRARRA